MMPERHFWQKKAITIMKSISFHVVLLSSLAMLCGQGAAADWPQFRGPLRDNVSHETGLLQSWPESGPKRLWLSTNLGSGYSGPVT